MYSGGFLAAAFLGEPLLDPLRNTQSVLLSTAVWYCMFYSPFDISYKLAKFLPVKIVIASMKEVYRSVHNYSTCINRDRLLYLVDILSIRYLLI